MEIKNVQKQKGFTLVEIAIVLVIIGLLLGGVLKGQELITNAKIKAVTSDFDNISAAYYAYQDRTGNIAGDSATPDGAIDTNNAFWFDLKREGFISGALLAIGTTVGPAHDLDGVWTGLPGNADPTLAMFTKNHICASNIPDSYAHGMDTKMDDGNPATGTIRAGATTAATIATGTAYADSDTLLFVCKEL
jgi:prepilin-type N-terminal cleavage/methylation domain-containing protein